MGKITLILGANNSGKSKYAEEIINKMEGKRYYIATMIPRNDYNVDKINKHILQRKDMNFTTIEEPYNLNQIDVDKGSVCLLEDVSNLLANNIFDKKRNWEEVAEDIRTLSQRCSHLVIVSIDGLEMDKYTGETKNYIEQLTSINSHLASISDRLIHM